MLIASREYQSQKLGLFPFYPPKVTLRMAEEWGQLSPRGQKLDPRLAFSRRTEKCVTFSSGLGGPFGLGDLSPRNRWGGWGRLPLNSSGHRFGCLGWVFFPDRWLQVLPKGPRVSSTGKNHRLVTQKSSSCEPLSTQDLSGRVVNAKLVYLLSIEPPLPRATSIFAKKEDW